MEAASEQTSLLDELEGLQNELIVQLDDLDQRVCRVLKEWTGARRSDPSADAGESETETAASENPVLGVPLDPAVPAGQDAPTC